MAGGAGFRNQFDLGQLPPEYTSSIQVVVISDRFLQLPDERDCRCTRQADISDRLAGLPDTRVAIPRNVNQRLVVFQAMREACLRIYNTSQRLLHHLKKRMIP